jgi:hypothetical protein
MGGPGILFVQESHQERWIRFYRVNVHEKNSEPELISNVSVRGEISRIAINPGSHENRVCWIKENGEVFRSYEDHLRQVSQEAFFRGFTAPKDIRQLFIDWSGENSGDPWRERHFIYLLDANGLLWAVNTMTEQAERWNERIVVPPEAQNVSLSFRDREYPVLYVDAQRKPVRVNARTGLSQVYQDVIIDAWFIPDEGNGTICEIEGGTGLVLYDTVGNKIPVNTQLDGLDIVSPVLVNGVLYFGVIDAETIRTNGKALL